MILYVNACARRESRTARLAACLLEKLGGEYDELKLYDVLPAPMDEEKVSRRSALAAAGQFDDPMFDLAHQFAAADIIVIAAPYWDMSFPSVLKNYIENIYAVGLVTKYSPDGMPIGMCRAKKLYYVTTAGGAYDETYGYGYVSALAKTCFGTPETRLIKAELLDIVGMDAEKILRDAEEQITL